MKQFKLQMGKVIAVWNEIEKNFITLFTIIMGAIIMVDVVLRNVGMQGIPWVEEFGRFMLVATTLMGSSLAVKSNGHMLMDVLYTVIPARPAYLLKTLAYTICSALYLYMGHYSWIWMMKQQMIGKTMQSCQFPAWIMWIFVVYGISSMGIRYAVQAVKCIKAFAKKVDQFTDLNTKEM